MDKLAAFAAAWPLFADSALTGLCTGALLGGLGVFVLLGRMVFVSAALAQVASFGVALGLVVRGKLLGSCGSALSPAVNAAVSAWSAPAGATLATGLGGVLLAVQARLRPRQLEALLGLLFAFGSAGTLVLASCAAADLNDIQSLLYGSAVAVLPRARLQATCLAGLVLGSTAMLLPALSEAWCDPQGAQVRQLPLRTLQGFVLLALTVSIAFATQVLGALPVFAFSVAPALAACAHSKNLTRSFVGACAAGGAAGFFGYVLAFCWDWPVGATQALVAVAGAVISWCIPARTWPAHRRAGPFTPSAV